MDELELLKQDWKTRERNFPKVSSQQIYKMLLKKSSSIVHWIFIISVAEFIFWVALDLFLSTKESANTIEELDLTWFYTVANILNYSVLVYFVVKFYLNFRKIKTTDSARELMKNILKTRRIVKHYVWFNLGFFALGVTVTFTVIMNQSETITQLSADHRVYTILAIAGIFLVILALMLGILWLFYRLLYGILTRRLKKNYCELEKLEM